MRRDFRIDGLPSVLVRSREFLTKTHELADIARAVRFGRMRRFFLESLFRLTQLLRFRREGSDRKENRCCHNEKAKDRHIKKRLVGAEILVVGYLPPPPPPSSPPPPLSSLPPPLSSL